MGFFPSGKFTGTGLFPRFVNAAASRPSYFDFLAIYLAKPPPNII